MPPDECYDAPVEDQIETQQASYSINVPIVAEKAGKVEFRDMISGVTVKRHIDEETGVMNTVVMKHNEDLHPRIVIVDENRDVLTSYSIPVGANISVREGQQVTTGSVLAVTSKITS